MKRENWSYILLYISIFHIRYRMLFYIWKKEKRKKGSTELRVWNNKACSSHKCIIIETIEGTRKRNSWKNDKSLSLSLCTTRYKKYDARKMWCVTLSHVHITMNKLHLNTKMFYTWCFTFRLFHMNRMRWWNSKNDNIWWLQTSAQNLLNCVHSMYYFSFYSLLFQHMSCRMMWREWYGE